MTIGPVIKLNRHVFDEKSFIQFLTNYFKNLEIGWQIYLLSKSNF
jgi:hypothetical protein